jgi:hypothetical protein
MVSMSHVVAIPRLRLDDQAKLVASSPADLAVRSSQPPSQLVPRGESV